MRLSFLLLLALLLILPCQAMALRVGLLVAEDNPLGAEQAASHYFQQLESVLNVEIESRWFSDPEQLLNWLQLHRQLDLALLPGEQPAAADCLAELSSVSGKGISRSWCWLAGPNLDRDLSRRLAASLRDISVAEKLPPTPAGPEAEMAPLIPGADPAPKPTAVSAPSASDGPLQRLQSQPVEIEADRLQYDQTSGIYHAEGAVRIQSGPISLHSESIQVNPETTEVSARGAVRISSPEGDVEGESLQLNLLSGLGRLKRGELLIRRQNFHVAGEEIEKIDRKTYHLTRGSFTTCDGDRPDWHFSARDLEVTIDGYAKGRHAVFYVRDIPVFYTPYLVYPVKRNRESGFLVPSAGYSEKRGTQISIPFYWVIARNQDATFYLDWLSELGLGKGVEYRYLFGDDNAGELDLYHITGIKGAENRFAYKWKHDGILAEDWRLKADVEYVSSRDYWEDFGEVAGEYNKDKVDSTVSINRTWGKLNLTPQIKYTKDLQKNNDQTLQRLPEIRFEAMQQRAGTSPFYYELASSSTYFWRRKGLKGERILARPALSAVWAPGDVVEIQPQIGYSRSHYWTSEEGPGYEDDGIYDFNVRTSTSLYRVFPGSGGLISSVRHSLEPEVVYTFIPDEDQSGLPEFDSLDRIQAVNRLSYGVTNRLVAKLQSEGAESVYHEFLYLRLSQEYDITESRRDLLNPVDERRPFSALRTELILRPTRTSMLDVDARYDPNSGQHRFTTFNAAGRYHDNRGNGVELDYRYRQDEVDYASAELDLALLKPVYLNYLHRYDLSNSRNLEKVLKLEYRSQCWSIYLTYRDRLDDTEYLFSFALSGLGRVAKVGGTLDEPVSAP